MKILSYAGLLVSEKMSFAEKEISDLLRTLQTQLAPVKTEASPPRDLVIVLTSQSLGHGDQNLGKVLTKFFLKSLGSAAVKPKLIILLSDGVLLACENSPVLGSLSVLQEQGVQILIDGTSVEYQRVEGKIKAGQVVSMLTIYAEIVNAGRVVTF